VRGLGEVTFVALMVALTSNLLQHVVTLLGEPFCRRERPAGGVARTRPLLAPTRSRVVYHPDASRPASHFPVDTAAAHTSAPIAASERPAATRRVRAGALIYTY
jgi:hypothetical protein